MLRDQPSVRGRRNAELLTEPTQLVQLPPFEHAVRSKIAQDRLILRDRLRPLHHLARSPPAVTAKLLAREGDPALAALPCHDRCSTRQASEGSSRPPTPRGRAPHPRGAGEAALLAWESSRNRRAKA
ncbi:MAG: hypothetical protein ACK559_17255, partial [bacterium]